MKHFFLLTSCSHLDIAIDIIFEFFEPKFSMSFFWKGNLHLPSCKPCFNNKANQALGGRICHDLVRTLANYLFEISTNAVLPSTQRFMSRKLRVSFRLSYKYNEHICNFFHAVNIHSHFISSILSPSYTRCMWWKAEIMNHPTTQHFHSSVTCLSLIELLYSQIVMKNPQFTSFPSSYRPIITSIKNRKEI